ncbi:MAG TPA: peptidoglycan-binding protein [Acidimicrobiia bacterium]
MRLAKTLALLVALGALLPPVAARAASEPVVFEGAGWGHGVGMSQYGSFEMAKEDKTAEQILAHYYTGTWTADIHDRLTGWLVDDPEPLWVHLVSSSQKIDVQGTASGLIVCQQEPDYVGLMKNGKNTEDVIPWNRLLEERLDELGFDPGPVDGIFDSVTDQAVRAFQDSRGLDDDGLVGPMTKSALWDGDGSDWCVIRTPVSGTVSFMPMAGGSRCMVTGAAMAAGCNGSVRGADPAKRIRLPQKQVHGSSVELAHGTLRIRPDRHEKTAAFLGLHAVLEIGIDDYTLGIDETILSWADFGGFAALEAQAIASRSYGVSIARSKGPESGFSAKIKDDCWCHLRSDTSSQVYSGWYAETAHGAIWRVAASETKGKIVTHQTAAVAQTLFSSSSGGRTEDNSAWSGGAQLPYLQSVEDEWSTRPSNPFRSWTARFDPQVVADKVGLDELTGVAVLERNRSGTARTVRFAGRKAGTEVSIDLKGTEVRKRFGLRSAYFDVSWGDTGGTLPGPGYPFGDIAGDIFVDDILWLYEQGLTKGCNPPANDNFCPDDSVTRGEMAVFLQRAFDLTPGSSDHFDDDDGKFYEEAANSLYEAGITSGCGPRRFCGGDAIPREQMAAFLARALDLEPAPQDFFVDDAKSLFQDEINRVAHADITRGCNPPANDRFCPTDLVTRGQLAAFLKRALD